MEPKVIFIHFLSIIYDELTNVVFGCQSKSRLLLQYFYSSNIVFISNRSPYNLSLLMKNKKIFTYLFFVKFETTSFVDLLCFCSVLCLLCFVYFFCGSFMFLFCLVFAMFCARLFICASWSPAGKGLTSWLSFVVSSVSLSFSHWYPGSGVVLDCIDS